jgi:hypothetical protein
MAQAKLSITNGLHAYYRPVYQTLLSLWLKKHAISRASFARQVGCQEKMVHYWCNGQCLPTLPYAFQIEKVTAGAVSAATWLGSEIGRTTWNQIQQRAKPK